MRRLIRVSDAFREQACGAQLVHRRPLVGMSIALSPYMSNSPYGAEDAGAFHFDDRNKLANAWARYANFLLGVWLFVSAFAWPHSRDACAAAWISGAMIAMNAFAAIWASPVRFFNVILGGIALLWQAAAASHEPTARMNGIVVSGLVIALSLVPPRQPAGL